MSHRLLPRIEGEDKINLRRIRTPRVFLSSFSPLQIYEAEQNIGRELLSRIRLGAYKKEGYRWHGRTNDKSVGEVGSLQKCVLKSEDEINYKKIKNKLIASHENENRNKNEN